MRSLISAVALLFALGSIQACSCDNGGTAGDGGTGDGGDDQGIGGQDDLAGIDLFQKDGIIVTLGDGGTYVCFQAFCQGKLYACGDCMDNDQDGVVDSLDPDCLGPCQNNEAGFFGNIPGQNNAPCKSDCYWDQDTGSGNDGCNWSHYCDPFEAQAPTSTQPEIGCNYDPNAKVPGATVPSGQKACAYLLNNQTTQCTNYCAPLTPNGCDCFGCCENPNNAGHFIFAGSVNAAGTPTCDSTPASLGDPAKCKPCTPVAGSCFKACGHCELCFGKTTLPADCFATTTDGGVDGGPPMGPDGGAPQTCPTGEAPCGLPGQGPCTVGQYCITGCCVPLIF